MNKNDLRQQAKIIRDGVLDKDLKSAQIQMTCTDIIKRHHNTSIVGTYMPIRNEITPPHVVDGCKMALPVIRDKKTLEFYSWAVGEPLVS